MSQTLKNADLKYHKGEIAFWNDAASYIWPRVSVSPRCCRTLALVVRSPAQWRTSS